ncbi:MAG: MFS transporter [Clostridiales bacterium]|nr:MFS transporter [Clostridiales bacterium]
MTVIYLLFFYIVDLGISAMAAGVIILKARIWDAFNDPDMGLVVDHTKSKHGKVRVNLLYGSLPLGIMTV